MAEDRKVLLDIELKSAESLKSLVELKGRIEQLKKEQKELNTTTAEGKIQYQAYQAQITNLSKESRSLENAIAQTAGAFNFEAGSIAANRAELSKLTAEYKNLAKPTKEQTDRIKFLSDALKQQEQAIGQAQRNVGNYTESINAAGLGNTRFGAGLTTAQEGFGKLKQGIDVAKTGFTTLKGAIAATGIGLLIIAFASLFEWFRKTDEGATALEGIMKGLGLVMEVLTSGVIKFGQFVFKAFTEPKKALEDFGNFLEKQIINRFNAFGVAIGGVSKLLSGDFAGGLKKMTDGAIQATTGIENGTDKIASFSKEVADAAKEGYELAQAFDALADAERGFQIQTAENNKNIDVLLLKMKNKSNTEKENLALASEASKIELATFNQTKALAEENLKLVTRENDTIRKQRGLMDEEEQKEVDAKLRIIALESESLKLQEKIANRVEAITQAADAKRKAAADKAAKELEDQLKRDEEYYNKRRALVAQADKEENDRTAFRLSQDVKNASERISMQQTQSDLLLQNENITAEQKIEIAKTNQDKILALIDERVQAEKEEANQIAAIQSEQGVNTVLIEQQRQQKIIDITNRAANEKAKIGEKTTSDVKKQSDAQQKIDEIRQKNALALASQSAGNLAGLFKENTIAFRILASVQALIDAYRAANAALASGSEINPIFGAVAAGSTLLLGLANVAKINGVTFAKGGYTGSGFGSPDESGFKQAGVVHEHEYVVPKRIVQSPVGSRMVAQLEGIRTRGYAAGGFVNDGGIGQRRLVQPVYESASIANRQRDIMESLPPIEVSVVEINKAQSKTAKVKDRANV